MIDIVLCELSADKLDKYVHICQMHVENYQTIKCFKKIRIFMRHVCTV